MSADLQSIMIRLQADMLAEYERIQLRGREDPGTAGDQGEENWAELLRGWLPSTYHVVTKGRIVGPQGESSPQVDVIVLYPAYPRSLISNKHYLASGVAAAFECKITLRAEHLTQAFENSVRVKSLLSREHGTPRKELFNPPYYGLLAHSHAWKASGQKFVFDMLERIHERQFDGPQEPWQMLDLICVANEATFPLHKHIDMGPQLTPEELSEMEEAFGAREGISTGYFCYWQGEPRTHRGTVLGILVSELVRNLAIGDSSLRDIASFYSQTNMVAGGLGQPNLWNPKILSEAVADRLRECGPEDDRWSEWGDAL